VAGSAAVFLATVGGLLTASGHDRTTNPISIFHPPDFAELFMQGKCFLLPEQPPTAFAPECYPVHRPEVILWGDSHAADLYTGVKSEFEGAGYSLGMFGSAACPPIIGYQVEGRPSCKETNDYVLSLIETRKPEIVIVSAFWKPNHKTLLENTLRQLATIPGVSVVVIGNTPVFMESVPVYLERRSSVPIKISDRSAAEHMMEDLIGEGRMKGIKYVPLKDLTCPDGHCLLTDPKGYVYYIDDGHLSAEGSRWVAQRIGSAILSRQPRG
jgi:SGNH domain (fused to AT3 domains)